MLTLGILNPVWETVAHHQALIDSAVYPDVTKSIAQEAKKPNANIPYPPVQGELYEGPLNV